MIRRNSGWEMEQLKLNDEKEMEDIMAVRLERKNGGREEKLMMIIAYFTVEGGQREQDENQKKYRGISDLINEREEEEVILMGDMNAHIGLLGERINRNGVKLLQFAEESGMEILNQTWGEARATWVRPGEEQRSAIDYCLVSRGARERVNNLWVDEENEVGVPSDHRLIVIQYGREEERRVEKKRSINKWNIRGGRWEEYREQITAMEEGEGNNVEEMDRRLKQDIIRCAERTIGRIKRKIGRKKRKPWWNREIKTAWNERREANRERRRVERGNERGEELNRARNEYEKKKEKVRVLIQEAMTKYEREEVERIRNKGEEGQKEWYKMLKGECRENEEETELIVNRVRMRNKEDIKREIKRFWEEIGRREGEEGVREWNLEMEEKVIPEDEIREMERNFTRDEIKRGIKKLKKGKAAGPDGIPN